MFERVLRCQSLDDCISFRQFSEVNKPPPPQSLDQAFLQLYLFANSSSFLALLCCGQTLWGWFFQELTIFHDIGTVSGSDSWTCLCFLALPCGSVTLFESFWTWSSTACSFSHYQSNSTAQVRRAIMINIILIIDVRVDCGGSRPMTAVLTLILQTHVYQHVQSTCCNTYKLIC